MKHLKLYRYDRGEDNTLGLLYVEGDFFCDTLELPWLDNNNNVSCIPTGKYDLTLEYHPRFKQDVYRFKYVPGRSGVLIHSANKASELLGCIAVGIKNIEQVSVSKMTMEKLTTLAGKEVSLEIVNL